MSEVPGRDMKKNYFLSQKELNSILMVASNKESEVLASPRKPVVLKWFFKSHIIARETN